MLKQMALVAELEAGFISDRTKAALAAAARGWAAREGPPKGRRRQRKGRSCARGGTLRR
jgi:DNA invertase Pin-like site-specific DNA recombinase